ncbi:MAG: hypothetical protein ACREIS_10295, partial [Nitrospiraceae bacterium]
GEIGGGVCMMTKKEAREYLKRWHLVNKFQAAELRRTPVKEKLRQMDAAYRMAAGLGILNKLAAAKRQREQEVSRRWRRLKKTAS